MPLEGMWSSLRRSGGCAARGAGGRCGSSDRGAALLETARSLSPCHDIRRGACERGGGSRAALGFDRVALSQAEAQQASRRAAARRAFLNPDGRRYTAGRDAGWSSLVARRAHNPEVAGSNPAPAIREALQLQGFSHSGPELRSNLVPNLVPRHRRASLPRSESLVMSRAHPKGEAL